MTTKQNKTFAVVIILAATLAISSCKKELVVTKSKTSEKPVAIGETFTDLQQTIMFEVTRNFSFKTETCETITDDTVSNPHVRTIDYGTGCVGLDGKTRRGKLIISYDTDDLMQVTGANSYTTFENYFVDDNQITGSFNVHNDGINGNGNYYFTVIGKLDEYLPNNGGMHSSIGQQEIEWIAGSNTPEKEDNVYAYTGAISGVKANGDSVSMTILQPLVEKRATGCDFYVSGVRFTQQTSRSDVYLDYGNGTCDNVGIETVDGNSQEVTLQ